MTDRKLEWRSLQAIRHGFPLSALGIERHPVDDKLCKLGPGQYCIVSMREQGPTVLSLLWAVSDSAARRAYFSDIEADDLATGTPPEELLPAPGVSSYRDILEHLKASNARGLMEHAAYRITSDGAFVHKAIESATAAYYFRLLKLVDAELPYAILWKLQ